VDFQLQERSNARISTAYFTTIALTSVAMALKPITGSNPGGYYFGNIGQNKAIDLYSWSFT
jgi:hypothetical protein